MKPNLLKYTLTLLNIVFLTGLNAQDFEYTTENGEVTITDYIGSDTEVTIPAIIEGLPVTKIADRAFYFDRIENLIIPESITNIGQTAFEQTRLFSISVEEQNPNYSSLDGVLFSKDMTTLIAFPRDKGQSSFVENSWDAEDVSYEIPSTVTHVANYAFYYSEFLTTLTLPNNLTHIGDHAFQLCTELTEIILPDSLIHIGEFPFQGCFGISQIHIPSNVTEIAAGAISTAYIGGFHGNLREITVDNQNPNYTSIDGVLFTKDLSTLVAYPPSNERSSYTIPNTVSSLSDYAFSSCLNLTEVSIPESVTDLGNYTFLSCYGLTEINLPNGITEIGDGVFKDCHKVRSIFIPNSVTKIGNYAFYSCSSRSPVYNSIDGTTEFNEINEISLPTSLTQIGDYAFSQVRTPKITIPLSLTEIGTNAFSNTNLLTAFEVHDQNPNYSSLDGVLFDKNQTTLILYPGAKTDSVYEIPQTVTTLSPGAFQGDYIFQGQEDNNLTELIIPRNLIDIGHSSNNTITNPFNQLAYLSSIQVDDQNPNFRSVDGVLFSKDMSTLITYPIYKKEELYEIPDTVTQIANKVFYNPNYHLKSVVIPSGVTTISSKEFPYSSSIPENINALRNIYFMGDAPEFSTSLIANSATLYYQPNTSGWDNIETPNGELKNQVTMYSSDLSELVNISTRAQVGTEENITIGGFTVKGEGSIRALVQGVGAELIDDESLTLENILINPSITVLNSLNDTLASNDDWNNTNDISRVRGVQSTTGSYLLENESKSAALIYQFSSGAYTVHLTGEEQGQGIALLEIYKPPYYYRDAQIINISTRGEVREGNEIIIGGFVIEGGLGRKVLIQGVGQELINNNDLTENNILADPIITLVDADGDTVSDNDNWESDNAAEKAQAMIDAGSFQLETNSKSAAIVEFLRPGAYTVLLSGVDNTQGIGLVEIYALDN